VAKPSSIDTRTMWHPGYLASQRIRKRIEEAMDLLKDHKPEIITA
jgi:hypothetical protein